MCSMFVCQSGNALKKSDKNRLNPLPPSSAYGLPSIESLPKYFSMDERLCSLKISFINDLMRVLFVSSNKVASGDDIR